MSCAVTSAASHARRRVAGVDEAGRGPLAGPVVAAAVILGPIVIAGLGDSKQKSARQRERLFVLIARDALAVGVGRAEVEEIDRLNIFQATLLAMQRAVAALPIAPHEVLIDGLHCPPLPCSATAVVAGDAPWPPSARPQSSPRSRAIASCLNSIATIPNTDLRSTKAIRLLPTSRR